MWPSAPAVEEPSDALEVVDGWWTVACSPTITWPKAHSHNSGFHTPQLGLSELGQRGPIRGARGARIQQVHTIAGPKATYSFIHSRSRLWCASQRLATLTVVPVPCSLGQQTIGHAAHTHPVHVHVYISRRSPSLSGHAAGLVVVANTLRDLGCKRRPARRCSCHP